MREVDAVARIDDTAGAFAYGETVLVGDLVRLRGLRESDLPALTSWQMDPAFNTTASNWALPMSEAAAKEKFHKWSANEHDDLGFSIETLDPEPILVGHLGLFGARPKDRCATVGIGLGREYVGRGYGTDAMRTIVGYGFREMGLHRIQLDVAAFNTAGIRAYAKAGFVEEGRRRQAIFHDGRWYDEVWMSILDEEWAAARATT
jgi:RimJ/RimL family protein N-acetyltransferase